MSLTIIFNWIWAEEVKCSPSSGYQSAATTTRGAPCEMRRIPSQNKGKKMKESDYQLIRDY